MVTKGTGLILLLCAILLWTALPASASQKPVLLTVGFVVAGLGSLLVPFFFLAKAWKRLLLAFGFLAAGSIVGTYSAYSWATGREAGLMVLSVIEPLLVGAFFYAWAVSSRIYHSLIKDAGEIGPPR